jgi:hypothetical protein
MVFARGTSNDWAEIGASGTKLCGRIAMKSRATCLVATVAVAFSVAAASLTIGADNARGATAQAGDAPSVATLVPMMNGFKWGQSPTDVLTAHIGIGGVIDRDYDPQLTKVQPGVQQKALEADRDNRKAAFQRSLIEFKDTPTGYDATPLKTEYSYRNKESLMMIDRAGKKRYFFFLGGRLWKIYDEIALDETSPLGATFKDAITKLQTNLGTQGRVRAADPAKGLIVTTVDWQDANTHLRALDRGKIVAVVLEERNTLNNLAQLRANKVDDPLALDPSISVVTKGGISDPNARPGASASASAGKKQPPPKK